MKTTSLHLQIKTIRKAELKRLGIFREHFHLKRDPIIEAKQHTDLREPKGNCDVHILMEKENGANSKCHISKIGMGFFFL